MFCFFSTARGGDALAKICYVPLGAETYIPMTMANIESHCVFTGEVDTSNWLFLDLQAMIKKAEPGGLFNDKFVRVKITIGGSDTVYIDNYGGIRIGESQYHLDDSTLAKVRKILQKITQKVISKRYEYE
jgi:hypothetical protein